MHDQHSEVTSAHIHQYRRISAILDGVDPFIAMTAIFEYLNRLEVKGEENPLTLAFVKMCEIATKAKAEINGEVEGQNGGGADV